ncbi:ABC transporter substrate-binding protein [Streptomyces sp. NBC_00059]|uniref:ABC transporter substrate-binding protein n=1 Tax=Streptomyces sp. NBC_00059 TaxID=2975635 RepID=UPI00224FC134|nr:ABC transporter substrate-binding protein [Streptomyces sp. NBC_00059]MCX5412665.1 ABC transporter substrate-binding protein [Streptomyces sp. NBC_00059]
MTREVWRDSAENEAASAVFHLMQELIDQYRVNRPVMPLVVAQAKDASAGADIDGRVEQIVRQVHRANQLRRVPVKLLDGQGDSPYEAALAMVRTLTERPWETRGTSQYKPFVFPRSRLLAAIEQATMTVVAQPGPMSAQERDERILEQLGSLRWRASRPGRGNWWDSLRASVRPETFLGAVFIAVLSVLLGEIGWLLTALVAAAALLGLAVVRLVTTAAPPLLWLRSASRWLATTSSLAASSTAYPSDGWSFFSPSGSWRVIRARAAAVAGRVADARAGDQHARQFHLELRVQALLEDLLHNYRPHALDWRRSKRTVPPVVFLPTATQDNGGVPLINAVNNVRSRRSEVDPLLLLASLPADRIMRHTPPLPVQPPANSPVRTGARARYEAWVADLSTGQAPAAAVRLAWVLRLPLSTGQLTHEHAHAQLVTHRVRRTWTWWVMSRTAVALVLVGALLGTFLWSEHWKETYCYGPLAGRSTDAVRLTGPGGAKECIGVATVPEVRFAGGNTLRLSGVGEGVTFERIEQAVREQNASIAPGEPHVTIVYAGPFTGTDTNREDTRKGLEELTGVYLHQRFVNDTANRSVKLRVLTANGGQDMLRQTTAVRKIIEVARRDSSVVGVVGLGRNTTESAEAMGLLQRAGLPVVDTTNSGSDLAREYSNYFGLAATDEEQADALGLIAGRLAEGLDDPQAVVLSRKVGNEDKDRYTTEQRRVGLEMLKESGFVLAADARYSLSADGGSANLDASLHTICGAERVPDALYFAGRVEDVNTLMSGLGQTTGCSDKAITVFTGDDLTKARFDDSTKLADKVTLYYGSLAPMSRGGGRAFYEDSRKALQQLLPEGKQLPALPKERPYEDRLFASGQSVISYQATAALYAAATRSDTPQSAAETWATLYSVALHDMPTGTITFRGTTPYADQKVHGLNIVEVTRPGPDARSRVVCGRAAGDPAPLTREDCRVS